MDAITAAEEDSSAFNRIAARLYFGLFRQTSRLLGQVRIAGRLERLKDFGGIGLAPQIAISGQGNVGQPAIESLRRGFPPIELR